MAADLVLQSNPVNFEAVRAIESVHIDGVSVKAGSIKRKCKGFLSLGTKQTVYNNVMFVLSGCLNVRFDCTLCSFCNTAAPAAASQPAATQRATGEAQEGVGRPVLVVFVVQN